MEDQRLPDPGLMIADLLVGQVAHAEAIFRQTLREFAALGEQMGTAEVLEGQAAVMAATDRLELSARLSDAAGVIRARIGTRPFPFHLAGGESHLENARELIGENQWLASWQQGNSLSPEDTLAVALG